MVGIKKTYTIPFNIGTLCIDRQQIDESQRTYILYYESKVCKFKIFPFEWCEQFQTTSKLGATRNGNLPQNLFNIL